ncbi:MFS transporter [Gluconobacter cerevisiae]|uniref:MFS transporter n=1 Tax=Gluconobacter cerevisiae TaxID=1379734 RepID=A0ABR9YGU9_9PROT|nr:MFS transporter [Gluconobacter cerevisiae]MBF0877898.1 MFS transporter [Gluconobacter cerevisiae]
MDAVSAAPVEDIGNQPNISQLTGAKIATRCAFFIAGFGLACWAPLVPFARERMRLSDVELGNLLLFLGIGSVLGMPTASALVRRLGSASVTFLAAVGIMLALPILATTTNHAVLAVTLLLFGASIGAIDVGANIHGTEVQAHMKQPLMSGFHGFYSIGGLIGSCTVTLALSLNFGSIISASVGSFIVLMTILISVRRFLPVKKNVVSEPLFIMPHGIVVLIGIMALITFLVEGAALDWGAILLTETRGITKDYAGIGYSAFAIAMTVARLVSDGLVVRVGNRIMLASSSFITTVGVAIIAIGPAGWETICGFLIAGAGAANLVPVLFTLAATQKMMPGGHAIAAVSTLGYLGVFLGPSVVGHMSSLITLPASFGVLAALMFVVLIFTLVAPLGNKSERSNITL